jgi:hypothetical protein
MPTPYAPLVERDNLHSRFWPRAPRQAQWLLSAVLIGGLALDAVFGWPGQIAASVATIAAFLWLFRHGDRLERCALFACLTIASAGEIFCSLVWGLYDYQFHNVPLFVPPGHALLMTLGMLLARRMPQWIVWVVPGIALPYVALGWWQGWDTAGVILFAVFAVFMLFGRAKQLYATMFLLSLLLEIYGTWLGNWTWHVSVPSTQLTTPNPPICAGAFYCTLDCLVLGVLLLLRSEALPNGAAAQSV